MEVCCYAAIRKFQCGSSRSSRYQHHECDGGSLPSRSPAARLRYELLRSCDILLSIRALWPGSSRCRLVRLWRLHPRELHAGCHRDCDRGKSRYPAAGRFVCARKVTTRLGLVGDRSPLLGRGQVPGLSIFHRLQFHIPPLSQLVARHIRIYFIRPGVDPAGQRVNLVESISFEKRGGSQAAHAMVAVCHNHGPFWWSQLLQPI